MSSVRSTAAGHVGQNSNAYVASLNEASLIWIYDRKIKRYKATILQKTRPHIDHTRRQKITGTRPHKAIQDQATHCNAITQCATNYNYFLCSLENFWSLKRIFIANSFCSMWSKRFLLMFPTTKRCSRLKSLILHIRALTLTLKQEEPKNILCNLHFINI